MKGASLLGLRFICLRANWWAPRSPHKQKPEAHHISLLSLRQLDLMIAFANLHSLLICATIKNVSESLYQVNKLMHVL